MVWSLSDQKTDEPYLNNKFSTFKFDEDHILITTDHGSWVVLSKEEYKLFRLGNLNKDTNLFNVLEDKGIIVTEKNIEKIIRDFRERYHFLFKGPTLHIVIPTFRCNMKCVYCHSLSKDIKDKKYDMDEETAKSIVNFIFKSPSENLVIEFQGGESLVNFDALKTIIEYAEKVAKKTKKKVLFNIVTNLTMMTEEKLDFLIKHNIMGLATSLDGPQELHDKNRKYSSNKGTYEEIVHWIKLIKTKYKKNFNLNALTTITRDSLSYPTEIPDELFKLGFDGVWLRFMNNMGFANQRWKKIGYTPGEYMNFWEKSSEHILKMNKEKNFIEIMTTILLKKILNKKDPMFVDIQSPCGAAITQILYDYKGDIYPCDESKIYPIFKLGNTKKSSYNEIFNQKTTKTMIDISSKYATLCDACPWSPFCGICLVNIYKSTGTIVPKLPEDFRCKIFKKMHESIFRNLIFSKNHREIYLKWLKKEKAMGE